MGAYAASLRTQGRVPRRRTARRRPPVAVAAIAAGLAGGQALALSFVLGGARLGAPTCAKLERYRCKLGEERSPA